MSSPNCAIKRAQQFLFGTTHTHTRDTHKIQSLKSGKPSEMRATVLDCRWIATIAIKSIIHHSDCTIRQNDRWRSGSGFAVCFVYFELFFVCNFFFLSCLVLIEHENVICAPYSYTNSRDCWLEVKSKRLSTWRQHRLVRQLKHNWIL